MAKSPDASAGVIWRGRPAIVVYVMLYAIVAAIAAAIFVGLEVYTADKITTVTSFFYASLKVGPVTIPDALEVVTVLIAFLAYLGKVLGLVLYRAGRSYELRTDGLYINRGIANLQNTFISAMAFSDARLVRTLGMRIVGLSKIMIEANDGRRFEMDMVVDGARVQSLIRSTLSHPTVRVDRQ